MEKSTNKKDEKIKIEHSDCNKPIRKGKVSLSKKTEKTYTVTVTYIQVSDEEAKIKRALIESVLKKRLR